MRKNKRVKILLAGMLTGVLILGTGCGREAINLQISECIGTTGLYDNNEPVESPKMKSMREIREREEQRQTILQKTLEEAEQLAVMYDYEGAIQKLGEVDDEFAQDDRVVQAKIDYQQKLSTMEAYDGDIPHIFFHSLIVDTDRAFDGDEDAAGYNWWMTTVSEFNKMMEQMYEKGYVLINIHETVTTVENEDGTKSYAKNMPMVPEGKKPFVLSIDDVNYYDYMQEDGFANRLVLDEQGNVKNLYIDAEGNELVGDYDVVPLLDEFVMQHPDFSLRGARGIVAETGYEGAFGYRVNDTESPTYEEDCTAVKAIADRLRKTGWEIASHSYGHGHMKAMGYDNVVQDTDKWLDQIGTLVGETDILLYPYGEEVDYPGDKLDYLTDKGFRFLCGVWGNQEFLEVNSNYVRQTRRNFDGYTMHYNPESVKDFFNVSEVLDPERPAFE